MAKSYHAQSEHVPVTATVGELIAMLAAHDPAQLVVFRTPYDGTFGGAMAFSVERATAVTLERREVDVPAETYYDDDDDTYRETQAYTQVLHRWTGVVIE